ncbi:MAG: energy-coupling factor transporter ATPase [Euryarchaeota archaeon]|nr:energy-coupling factor transporter ATPase [Euryarchaeota archaeon]
MIRIEHLSFAYEKEWVLKDIDLEIKKGDFVLIVGKSGSGKSTLALAISGFLKEKSKKEGNILFKGKKIDEYELFDLAKSIGMVQQDPENQICTLNVTDELSFALENLCFGKRKMEERIHWALSIVGAEHLRDRGTFSLSGGEKQKIAIASVLAMKPEVIIFDEPTSNLDPAVTEEIFSVIGRIRKKTDITVIVIEHKWEYLLDRATKILLMENGSLKPVESLQPPDYKTITRKKGEKILEVEDLSFSYGKRNVLDGLSFEAYENEVIGVMGGNGSGKTTLLMSLMNFLDYSGDIKMNGESIKDKKTSDIAKKIGLIFQNPNHQIFESSVLREAEFAPKNFGMDKDVEPYLKKGELKKYENNNPFRLSHGEKRRLNIISVLSYNPKIILIDEPFIGQDPENVRRIMEMLLEKDNLIIMVLHNRKVAEAYCSRILLLKNGKLEEEKQ